MKTTGKLFVKAFRLIWNKIYNTFFEIKRRWKLEQEVKALNKAHRMAIQTSKIRNKTYYVLRRDDGEYVWLNSDEIKMYKRNGLINPRFDHVTQSLRNSNQPILGRKSTQVLIVNSMETNVYRGRNKKKK